MDETAFSQRAEKRRQKRLRHKERKLAALSGVQDSEDEPYPEHSAVLLRAEAPEFCPQYGMSELQMPCSTHPRLLPPFVENIAWSYESFGGNPCNENLDLKHSCLFVVDPVAYTVPNDFGYSFPTMSKSGAWENNDVDLVLGALACDNDAVTRSTCVSAMDLTLARILVHTVVSRLLQRSVSHAEPEHGLEIRSDYCISTPPPLVSTIPNGVTGMLRSEAGQVLSTGGVPTMGFFPRSIKTVSKTNDFESPVKAKAINDSISSEEWRTTTPEPCYDYKEPAGFDAAGKTHGMELLDGLAEKLANVSAQAPYIPCYGAFELMVDHDGNERLCALPR